MSLLAAPLASLFLFSGLAVAQIYAPGCTVEYSWSYNSLSQNPCTVAAYMMGTCNGGSFSIDPLTPGYTYVGPSGVDNSDLCKCNTVGFSLISACAACQGATPITWSEFRTNCTKVLEPSTFPNPVPSGTRVPHWALVDPTNENAWNATRAYITGDTPEVLPGAVAGASTSATRSTKATGSVAGSTSNTATPVPAKKHSSNAAAIAGGVVGGIALISIILAGLFFLRRRSLAPSESVATAGGVAGGVGFDPHMNQIERPLTGQETITSSLPGTTTSLLRHYNPDDPSTFPGHQGAPSPPFHPAQLTTSSLTSSRNLYTVASMPVPQSQEYHGLPIV